MQKMENINLLDFAILSILNAEGATAKFTGLTINAINTDLSSGRKYLSRKVLELVNKGYIGTGLMDGRANTYYITSSGIELLEIVKGEKEEV